MAQPAKRTQCPAFSLCVFLLQCWCAGRPFSRLYLCEKECKVLGFDCPKTYYSGTHPSNRGHRWRLGFGQTLWQKRQQVLHHGHARHLDGHLYHVGYYVQTGRFLPLGRRSRGGNGRNTIAIQSNLRQTSARRHARHGLLLSVFTM
jgi:hypothetical protein